MKRWLNGVGREDIPKKRIAAKCASEDVMKRLISRRNDPNNLEDHLLAVTQLIRNNDATVIMGWPRQGKSSCLPRLLHCLFGVTGKNIAVVQNTNFEAKRCALLVKRDEEKRSITGFVTPFEEEMDTNTKIRIMTSECFLHEFWDDQTLEKYSAVIVDDFHLRQWQTELTICYLRFCLKKRKHLKKPLPKIVFLGCPCDTKWLENYLKGFTLQTILLPQDSNKQTEFLQVESQPEGIDVVQTSVLSLISCLEMVSDGNFLCYLPGPMEVDRARAMCTNWLRESKPDHEFRLLTLSETTGYDQEDLHSPGRKVIFTDETAQNALLSDVRVIVDNGIIRVNEALDNSCSISVNRWRSISRLEASVRERRLERGQSSYFIRLYNANESEMNSDPKILTSDLADLLLWLHWCCAESNPCLPCGISVRDSRLTAAKDSLQMIGAIRSADISSVDPNKLTRIGWQMSSLPLGWRESRSLLAAAELGCLAEVLTIVAMLQAGPVFLLHYHNPRKSAEAKLDFRCSEGDALTLLRVYREFRSAVARKDRHWCQQHSLNRLALFRALMIRRRLREICLEQELPIRSCGDNLSHVNLALLHGFVSHLARHTRVMTNGEIRHRYRMLGANGSEVELSLDSSLYSSQPPEMLFHLGLDIGMDQIPLIKRACPTDAATIMRVFPGISLDNLAEA